MIKRYILGVLIVISGLQVAVFGMEGKEAKESEENKVFSEAEIKYLKSKVSPIMRDSPERVFHDLKTDDQNKKILIRMFPLVGLIDIYSNYTEELLQDIFARLETVDQKIVATTTLADLLKDIKDRCGSAMYTPVRKRMNSTILQYLLQGFLNSEEISTEKRRIRHYIVQELLKYPFDLNQRFFKSINKAINRDNELQITVLHAAVMLDDAKLVEMILNMNKKRKAKGRARVNVNAQDSERFTPLQRLIQRNDALYRDGKLLPKNANMNAEHIKIAQALKEAGAEFYEYEVDAWFGGWLSCCRRPLAINQGIRDLFEND